MTSTCRKTEKAGDLLQEREIVEKVLLSLLEPLGYQKGRLFSFALIGYSLGPGYRHEFSNLDLKEVLIVKAPSHSRLTSSFRSQVWRDAVKTPLSEKKWQDLRHLKQSLEDWLNGQREVLNMEIERKSSLLLSPQDAPTTQEALDWIFAKRGYVYDALLSRQHMQGNGRMFSRTDLQESISTHLTLPQQEVKVTWYKTDFSEKIGEPYLKAESSPKSFSTTLKFDQQLDAWLEHARVENTVIKARTRKIRDDSEEEQQAKMHLRSLVNSRLTVRSVVERISWKNGWNGFIRRLILLRDVVDTGGNLLGQNFWVNDCKAFQKLDIAPGDEIEFSARVERVVKERVGPPDPLKPINEEVDKVGYRIARPNKAKMIKKTKTSVSWW